MASGRTDRKARLTEARAGWCATASQDYLSLAVNLYSLSSAYAKKRDGNASIYPLAGIPLLVSTIRALLIEANSGMCGNRSDPKSMARLAKDPNEIGLISEKYQSGNPNVAIDIALLYEVRNEIVHPAHTPSGTTHNTPTNMLPLRDRRLLRSAGKDDGDYGWIAQLQSHRLFRWAFFTVERVAEAVLSTHYSMQDDCALHLGSYRAYQKHDLT
jgi:hypothetical protein